MPSNEEIQNALLAINSRLGAIEGKVNLVARADRESILVELEKTVRKHPLIGQVYLLLDGARTQKDVHNKLLNYGLEVSQPTISRCMAKMENEHGVADLVQGGNTKIYAKDRAMERVLNLSANIRKWLGDEKQVIPEEPTRRRKGKS